MRNKSDEWYTPQWVMDKVFDYVEKFSGVDKSNFVRPFYPGGDYENFIYPEGCIVVDNPPFSIMKSIVKFYNDRKIKFFLFAPAQQCNNVLNDGLTSVISMGNTKITYVNGEDKLNLTTAFLTNIPEKSYMVYCRELDCEFMKNFRPNFYNVMIINRFKFTDPIYIKDLKFTRTYDGKEVFGQGFIKEEK